MNLRSDVRVFGRDPWPHEPELAALVIEGAPKRNEVVFFHRATRTLYTADLVFNIHRHAGLLTPLTFRAMGIYKRFAVAKMWNHWIKDRAAFDRSIERMLAWDFDRIVMAHGDIVETGGRRMLIDALRERKLLSA
jgi:glyoxylase-like metal-dependent hydrolase (beta-lactamase superfamily II)